jgi:hypothetical protein
MNLMKLFREYELRLVMEEQNRKLNSKVERYTNDEIMANDIELLADNCFEEFRIVPVDIGDEEFSKRSINQGKIKKESDPGFRDIYHKGYVEVDGIVAKFYFPYTGKADLFKCQASTFSLSGYPEIDLLNGFMVFTYQKALFEMQSQEDRDKLLDRLNRDLSSIKTGLDYVNSDVKEFNRRLRDTALKCLEERRKKIEQFFSISQMLEVPLKKSDFATTQIPMQRKIIPVAKKYSNEQAYCISDIEYEFILDTIKHNGSTYERTPSSYRSMHEEDLRNTLLAALNGMYQGGATGEAFRNKGKTDICIEKDNRAAFVAECKMWTGQGSVADAVNQLDSYLTWRDCKVALIYFVRKKDFVRVLSAGQQALKSMPSMRQVKELDKNEFECCLISASNPGQLINIRVMLFNLYSA